MSLIDTSADAGMVPELWNQSPENATKTSTKPPRILLSGSRHTEERKAKDREDP